MSADCTHAGSEGWTRGFNLGLAGKPLPESASTAERYGWLAAHGKEEINGRIWTKESSL